MATVSYLLTSGTQGTTFDLGSLSDGLMKFAVSGGSATPATAVASTTSAVNDYQGGSLSLSNIDAQGNTPIGSMLIGTGDSDYWNTLNIGTVGSILYVADTLAGSSPAWGPLGADNTVLASMGGLPQYVGGTASSGNILTFDGSNIVWAAPVDDSDWSTFPATQNVDMANFSLEAASGVFARLVNITGTADAILPDFGTGSLSVDVDPNNYLHYTSQTIGTNIVITATPADYAAVGSLLVGNLIDYDPLTIGTVGQVLTSDGTTAAWATPSSGGTVTSVAATSTDLTITGSPITTAGTLDFTLNTVTTSKGGTGQTSYDPGDMLYYSSGTLLNTLGIGAANTIMSSDGTSPAWVGGTAASGNILTFDGADVVWAPNTGDASAWSTFPATQDVDFDGFSGLNMLYLLVNDNVAPPVTGVGQGAFAVNSNYPYFISSAIAGNVIITSTGPAEGAVGSLLVGNAVDYSQLPIGTIGQVLTSDGSTASWATPSAGGTVTSVGLTSTGNSLDITGTPSPITGSGTFNVEIKTTNSPSLNDVLSVSQVSPLDLTWVAPAAGGFTWVSVAGTSQTMAANTGYFANNVAPTTFTFPATPSVGDVFEIVGPSLWILSSTGPQNIIFGTASVSGGSSFAATNSGDTIRVICSNADVPGSETFRVLSVVGNLDLI